MRRRAAPWLGMIVAAGLGSPPAASAQSNAQSPAPIAPAPPILWDPGRRRAELARAGVETRFVYTGDLLSDVAGGVDQGPGYSGKLAFLVDADLDRAGWPGAKLHFGLNQIHGPGSTRDVGNLMPVSSVEAEPATRLFTFWVEQQLSPDASLRFGKITGLEFVVSDTAALFVNSTYGWPAILSQDLPSGGPSYALATAGLRLKWAPREALTLQGAVFNGDPAESDRAGGLNWFDISSPPLFMGEAWFGWGGGSEPGVLKLGAWRHTGRFASAGQPPGAPADQDGDWGAYVVLDQTLPRSKAHPDRGVSVFTRMSAAPSDRNLVDLYADAGLVWKGPLRSRPDDSAGVAVAYARVSPQARDAIGPPSRDHEIDIELTYQAQLSPALTLQPDLQIVLNPGAGAPDPADPRQPIPNAVVIGLRALLNF